MQNWLMRAVVFLLSFGVAGCAMQGTQDSTLPSSGPRLVRPMETYGGTGLLSTVGTLAAALLDSSPSLNGKTVTHFYIGVDEVDAMANGTAYPVASFGSPYVVDLLQYQNGAALSLGAVSLPAQSYSQLRLVLNAASTQVVFSDGSSSPVSIKTSNSQSSANAASQTSTTSDPAIAGAVDVTVSAPFSIASGGSTSISADFNALESLTANNNGVFIRPSMFVANGAGQITGSVVNAGGGPVQNAVVVAVGSNGAVANTSATDANGNFNLHALQAGTYQLSIYNGYTTASGQSITALGQSSSATSLTGPSITITSGGPVSVGILKD